MRHLAYAKGEPWMVTHPRLRASWVFWRRENLATETAVPKAAMTEASAPIAAVVEADGRPVEAIVGIVRPTTPIGTAARVVRRVGNGVTAGDVTIRTLARRAPGVVIIGTDGPKGLAAVFG